MMTNLPHHAHIDNIILLYLVKLSMIQNADIKVEHYAHIILFFNSSMV